MPFASQKRKGSRLLSGRLSKGRCKTSFKQHSQSAEVSIDQSSCSTGADNVYIENAVEFLLTGNKHAKKKTYKEIKSKELQYWDDVSPYFFSSYCKNLESYFSYACCKCGDDLTKSYIRCCQCGPYVVY